MDSVDSLWNIELDSDNVTLDLRPGDQTEIVEGLPFSLGNIDTFSLSQVQPVRPEQQSSAGVKRRRDETLDPSYIQQSKVVIVSGVSEEQQEPLVTLNLPTATNSQPSLADSPGLYGFSVMFSQLEERARNKTWEFSQILNKLYSDMDRWVLVEFTAPAGFFIRALPVFSLPSDMRHPVKRCPGHAAPSEKTNKNFPYPDHLVRVEGEDSVYQEDSSSGRLSVLFPVLARETHSSQLDSRLIKFMCLGSDPGGINRRPVKLVFTLEDGTGLVVGRQVVDLRLCSNPKRDKVRDEEKHLQHQETARNIANSVRTKSDPATPVINLSERKYLMIPVRVEDYKNVEQLAGQMAQSWEILEHPDKPHAEVIQSVKEERMKLQLEHNPGFLHLLANKKKKN